MEGANDLEISKMSDADKRDLQQTLQNEMQKAKIQESVHHLTEICFTKCVTAKISSAKLDRAEEACAQNCVERFMDANETVIRHLESMRRES